MILEIDRRAIEREELRLSAEKVGRKTYAERLAGHKAEVEAEEDGDADYEEEEEEEEEEEYEEEEEAEMTDSSD